MIDPITAVSFAVFENKGVYALLLGSGISRAAQIPTGWEITVELVRRLALLQKIEEQVDWAEWYKNKYGKELTYSDVLDSLASTADQRRSILHSFIEPTEEDIAQGRKVPTKAHRAIARLIRDGFIKVVITTNFDRLLENSLREIGVEPVVISSDDDLTGAIPLAHTRCYVLKLHGDYLDTRIKNTDRELKVYSKQINRLLDRIFDEFGLIVCGWSAEWDEALRGAIARAPNRRYTTFWATRSGPPTLAQDLIRNRSARVVEITDADEFFTTIQRNCETQAELQGQDPRSIDLLLANAKRAMGRTGDQIQLEEIIGREIRLLVEIANTDEFSANGSWSNERFQRTVMRYETIAEPSVRLFGILGRWGSGSEFKTVVDVIQNLSSVETRNGLVVFNNLRVYPARLLLFGYGLGLLKAQRYDELFRLFTYSVTNDRDREKTLVDTLVAGEGDDKDIWNGLEEFPEHNRKMPLSDHLHAIFSKWTSDYLVFGQREYTRLFESFELLGALAYLTLTQDEALLEAAVKGGFNQVAWAPMGRASWDGETRRAIFEDWRRNGMAKQLTAAGFVRNSGPFLDLALKNLDILGNRLRW